MLFGGVCRRGRRGGLKDFQLGRRITTRREEEEDQSIYNMRDEESYFIRIRLSIGWL